MFNRNTNCHSLSTQVPGSPQQASRTFKSNAVTLIVGRMPTDPNACSMIRLTLSALSGVGHQAVVARHDLDPFQGTSAYRLVALERRRPAICLPKSCFIPDQPGCVLTHPETKWLLLVQPVAKIAPAAHWAITTNQYASNLIIGFSPNLWNSLTMIILTTSALSGVVMIES